MGKKNSGIKILTGILGIATLATFFVSETWAKDAFGIFDIARIVIYILFLASALWIVRSDIKTDDSHKVLPGWVKVLMLILPTLALLFALVNALFPHLGGLVRMSDNDIFTRPGAILRMLFEFIACGVFVSLLPHFMHRKQWAAVGLAATFSLVLFVMGMEEISWGQRIFQWQTSAYFSEHNVQGETNLHNLNTQLFQDVLFFGGFILLAALPFFHEQLTKILQKTSSIKFLTNFLPEQWMLVAFGAGLMFTDPFNAPYGFHWGSICFQLIATLALLWAFAIYARSNNRECKVILWALLCAVIVLILSLSYHELWRLNQGLPTEYIKLFINFGILCWALRVRERAMA